MEAFRDMKRLKYIEMGIKISIIRNKWDKWIVDNNKNNQYIWI